MIEVNNDQLVISFPDVHEHAVCRIEFQRTLRIPDDNRYHPLPAGLGRFPLGHIDDYADKVPGKWAVHGGVFLPMYQAEAMWIRFSSRYPMAIKIAAGKINAVTGDTWVNDLTKSPQDYLIVPDQPWLDGFCVEKGLIRQFVAMPLGEGYTAEEQLTGEAKHGGLQIVAYPMKAEMHELYSRTSARPRIAAVPCPSLAEPTEMGLAPGGLMRQEIFRDHFGFDVWDRSIRSRCYVHILNSVQFLSVTGTAPPTKPPTAEQYVQAGLPWFEYYDADQQVLRGAPKLAGLDSVAAKHFKKGEGVLSGNEHVIPKPIKKLGPHRSVVREGDF